MKPISTDLATHIAGEVTTLATCWKVTRRDASIAGFTDHDVDVIVDGVTYRAASGFTPTAIESTADLSVDNLDVEGMLSSDAIGEEDILASKYDFAQVDIFQVNYNDLTQGTIPLRTGWLGEVTLQDGRFVAEIRGLAQKLSRTLGELYSPSCRAQLGDARCKINLASHTYTGTVTSSGSLAFGDTDRDEDAGTFTNGIVHFTSGANNGLSMEVKEYVPGVVTLALPMPYAIEIGDEYSIVRGCDKTLGTCRDTFGNVNNFRGEPHVPGIDKMLETAGTRSK